MINSRTNTGRGVALVFNKQIIEGNLQSDYQWQQSACAEEAAGVSLKAVSRCCLRLT